MAKSTENTKTTEKAATKTERRFAKSQLCNSKKFEGNRYLLDVILDESATYTIEEVEKILKDCIKKEV